MEERGLLMEERGEAERRGNRGSTGMRERAGRGQYCKKKKRSEKESRVGLKSVDGWLDGVMMSAVEER